MPYVVNNKVLVDNSVLASSEIVDLVDAKHLLLKYKVTKYSLYLANKIATSEHNIYNTYIGRDGILYIQFRIPNKNIWLVNCLQTMGDKGLTVNILKTVNNYWN